ncbi:hypothetical protein P7K49_014724 [Saguinus oedipus]|uniref:Uncharacterized protein n=1 Tax=Saguinus oedipus TaxID=9490 RepID=A0ABQ9V817_SAGOE|nr:hypothetical protein P7K49_014724 [Saguinus oedipus]
MNGQPAKAPTSAERSRSAWNTLYPNASPKRDQLRVTSEFYEVEVAPDPTALEPAQLDLGASEGRDLQHIVDQKTTKGPIKGTPQSNGQMPQAAHSVSAVLQEAQTRAETWKVRPASS